MAALREALPPLPITWADNRGNQGRSVGFTADGRPVTQIRAAAEDKPPWKLLNACQTAVR